MMSMNMMIAALCFVPFLHGMTLPKLPTMTSLPGAGTINFGNPDGKDYCFMHEEFPKFTTKTSLKMSCENSLPSLSENKFTVVQTSNVEPYTFTVITNVRGKVTEVGGSKTHPCVGTVISMTSTFMDVAVMGDTYSVPSTVQQTMGGYIVGESGDQCSELRPLATGRLYSPTTGSSFKFTNADMMSEWMWGVDEMDKFASIMVKATSKFPDPITCFPGDAMVLTPRGETPMKDLHTGDEVVALKSDGTKTVQKIALWAHRDPAAVATEWTKIDYRRADGSEGSLRLSGSHFVAGGDAAIPHYHKVASEFKVGETIWYNELSQVSRGVVTKIESVASSEGEGVYLPRTLEGVLIVDGMVVSELVKTGGLLKNIITHDFAVVASKPVLLASRLFEHVSGNRPGIFGHALKCIDAVRSEIVRAIFQRASMKDNMAPSANLLMSLNLV